MGKRPCLSSPAACYKRGPPGYTRYKPTVDPKEDRTSTNAMVFAPLLVVAFVLVSALLNGPIAASPTDNRRRWDKSATAHDQLWFKAVCKGGEFVEAFPGSDEEAAKIFKPGTDSPTMQSEWQGDLKGICQQPAWGNSTNISQQTTSLNGAGRRPTHTPNISATSKPSGSTTHPTTR